MSPPSAISSALLQVKKRDGRIVNWNSDRIIWAVNEAMKVTGEGSADDAVNVASRVAKVVGNSGIIDIELIQDAVEESLIIMDYPKTAKAYILYRHEKEKQRTSQKQQITISPKVAALVKESKSHFKSDVAELVYYMKYARWIDSEGRRETWIETVTRYIDFMRENIGSKLSEEEYHEIFDSILNLEVLPSMRLLWSAGDAARKNNVCCFNCSYIAPTKIYHFAEIMFISMSGCGVGFSVESSTCEQLPIVKKQKKSQARVLHTVDDSKEGWCDALTLGLTKWWNGEDVDFDYSKVRPAGTRLKTMGGRASGPEPLKNLLQFAKSIILSRQGKRLRNIDVHDIICKIGDVVVSGGVRRSAMISLSDADDQEMLKAKFGAFHVTHPHRQLSNNSAVYEEKPSATIFMKEWLSLAESGTGERGIFNREGVIRSIPQRRKKLIGDDIYYLGGNPCLEIILRGQGGQFCNLSEVVCRENDTIESLKNKVRIATIIGTYQSMLTNFTYISDSWKKNSEEERLLGVSLTGQWDCKTVRNADVLTELKNVAINANKIYADKFNISPSTAITCTKPSGSVSKIADSASGVHPRYAKYYIQRVRIDAKDPLFEMIKDSGYPHVPEVGMDKSNATRYVIDFPVKAPEGAVTRHDVSAIQQLEYWKLVKENYTEHTVSCTVYVRDDEWLKVGNWVYEHFNSITGVSFLPYDNGLYQLAPLEEITENKYNEMVATLPKIDFSRILVYEKSDETVGAKELACSSGSCEL